MAIISDPSTTTVTNLTLYGERHQPSSFRRSMTESNNAIRSTQPRPQTRQVMADMESAVVFGLSLILQEPPCRPISMEPMRVFAKKDMMLSKAEIVV